MRVEWAKAYARVQRWKEEHVLVLEEMRRVLHYCVYKHNWWHEQAGRRIEGTAEKDGRVVTAELMDGLRAYSAKQAAVWDNLGAKCAARWIPLLAKSGDATAMSSWPSKYTMI